ncbi:Long-chain-fatty-acid- ligase [Lasiodiplodia theobromae]|uniref:Long-chain-fatty-acid- ligase n=1 Tax=Lasiodiplodia theobromae TaxID=45133 RepID=UPI0015C2FFDC|nr:Long-chain-fatty-acid- ligase [Lasiodiplodia theobromae]KAF4541436.1 Long-chain-fatty-acid- ligase [Lasiodiplodia theobromae]
MGSVASPFPTLPNIESLRALFPSNLRGSEYSVAYVYSGVALLAFGEEKRIPELWQQIARVHADSEAAQVVAVKRLREGMTKASPLVGFPRAINALTALQHSIKQTCPPSVLSALSSPSPPSSDSQTASSRRGQALFDSTYGPHASRVRGNLDAISGGVLGGFAVKCVYGELLAAGTAGDAEEGEEVDGRKQGDDSEEGWRLSAKESAELVFVACLAAGQGAQAKG